LCGSLRWFGAAGGLVLCGDHSWRSEEQGKQGGALDQS
jgi:hypothetical protein